MAGDDKNWWERNVEDEMAADQDRQRALLGDNPVEVAKHDVIVGVGKGVYNVGKGMVVGIADVAIVAGKLLNFDGPTYSKIWDATKWLATESYTATLGSAAEKQAQNDRANATLGAMAGHLRDTLSKEWDDAAKAGKRTELLTKWTTEGILTVASFLIGAGELKALATAGKAGDALGTAEVLANVTAKCPKLAAAEEAAQAAKLAKAADEAAALAKAAEEASALAKARAAEEAIPKKKLGLGLRNKNTNYVQWSKEKGFNTYGELSGRGSFSEQIESAMSAADEIHFNLKDVDVSRASGRLNDFGEPLNGNYTNYELYLIKEQFSSKVVWHAADGTVMPKGWMPPGL